MATKATRDLRATTARRSVRVAGDILLATRYSLLALFVLSHPLAAQTPQDVQKVAEQAIRKLDVQTTLPRGPEPLRFPFGNFQMPAEVLWLVIIVALGVLIYAFRDYIPIGRWGQGGAWTPDEAAVAGGDARAPTAVL